MRDHTEIRRKLPAYLDDDVSAEEKQEIKKHLGTCGICRGALADLELTMWHLKRLPEIEPPPWLSEKILSKVRVPVEPKPSPWLRIFSPTGVKLPLVVLALLLLCGIGFFIFRTLGPKVIVPAPSPAPLKTTPRPAPAGPSRSLGVPAPLRAPSPVVTPTLPEAPAAVPPSGGEASFPAPAHIPSPAPKAVLPPTPALPEESEVQSAGEEALPGREALQPFGQEEQGATQGGVTEKHPQGK
jgi:hypothetical protein